MRNRITGKSRISSNEVERVLPSLSEKIRTFRFVHELERLVVAAFELVLNDASIEVPVGTDGTGIYLGVDNCIEDIKNKFLLDIIKEGVLGASPLLFPFTSPNSLAAQAAIMFDIRGESMIFPVERPEIRTILYADECVAAGYAHRAIAGHVFRESAGGAEGSMDYFAELFFLETPELAEKRHVRIYGDM